MADQIKNPDKSLDSFAEHAHGDAAQELKRFQDGLEFINNVRNGLVAQNNIEQTGAVDGDATIIIGNDSGVVAIPKMQNINSIGRFDIRGELGEGGFAKVYLAYDPILRREIAVKVLKINQHSSTEAFARFQREARAAATLSHPNIVPVFDVGVEGSQSYIVSAYCEGSSLAQWIEKRKTINLQEAAEIVVALAGAVEHAHQRGIIHRDIKPANVLVEGAKDSAKTIVERLRVTDFGLAKIANNLDQLETVDGAIVGTPAFMSPEQAMGEEVTKTTDVYSTGVVLYQLLTGQLPLLGETHLKTLYSITNEDPQPPSRLNPTIPKDLDAICLKCLNKLPQQRYDSAFELAEDLNRWRRGEPVSARMATLQERVLKWCDRNRLATAAASGISIAGLLVFWSLIFGLRESLRATALAKENAAQAIKNAKELEEATFVANQTTSYLESVMVSTLGDNRYPNTKSIKNNVDPRIHSLKSSATLATYLGRYANDNKNFDLAKKAFSFAIEEFKKLDEEGHMTTGAVVSYVTAHDQLAHASYQLGEHENRAKNLRTSLKLWQRRIRLGDVNERHTITLARCYMNLSLVENPKDNANKAHEILKPLLDSNVEARWMAAKNLGNLSDFSTGQESLDAIENAIELASRNGDETFTIQLFNKAMLHFGRQNQPEKASEHWERAVALGNRLLKVNPESTNLNNTLAQIYYNRASVSASAESRIELLSEALALMQVDVKKSPEAKSAQQYYMTLVNLAISHLMVGNNMQALLNLTEAVNVMESYNKKEFLIAAKFLKLRAISAFDPMRALKESRELHIKPKDPSIVDTCILARAQINARAYSAAKSGTEKTKLFEDTVADLISLTPGSRADADTLKLVQTGVEFADMLKDERIKKVFKIE